MEIDRVRQSYIVEAESIHSVPYMNICFDYVGPVDAEKYPDFHKWRYKGSKNEFTCYYCRYIMYGDDVICVDFGSYSNFVVVAEGDHVSDIKEYFNNYVRSRHE